MGNGTRLFDHRSWPLYFSKLLEVRQDSGILLSLDSSAYHLLQYAGDEKMKPLITR